MDCYKHQGVDNEKTQHLFAYLWYKPNTHATPTPVLSTEPLQVSKITASTLGFHN